MVFMTEQQKDLERLAAWDRYQDSRETILALKSKLEGWRKPLQTLAEKIARDQVHETDHFGIPTREEFTETVRQLHEAKAEYERAFQSARDFGFPVEKEPSHPMGIGA